MELQLIFSDNRSSAVVRCWCGFEEWSTSRESEHNHGPSTTIRVRW